MQKKEKTEKYNCKEIFDKSPPGRGFGKAKLCC
jgi:hypothetical protein